MKSCPHCGSPPQDALNWSCGSTWKFGGVSKSQLCRIRELTHALARVEAEFREYEAAVLSCQEDLELAKRVKQWAENNSGDPWELVRIVKGDS